MGDHLHHPLAPVGTTKRARIARSQEANRTCDAVRMARERCVSGALHWHHDPYSTENTRTTAFVEYDVGSRCALRLKQLPREKGDSDAVMEEICRCLSASGRFSVVAVSEYANAKGAPNHSRALVCLELTRALRSTLSDSDLTALSLSEEVACAVNGLLWGGVLSARHSADHEELVSVEAYRLAVDN